MCLSEFCDLMGKCYGWGVFEIEGNVFFDVVFFRGSIEVWKFGGNFCNKEIVLW